MALDEKIWEEVMEFKPERFMEVGSVEKMDITRSREVKMMHFYLEYIVSNLVEEFEWRNMEGEEIDL
ncbi:hypothetical protein IEQ34_000680 [Dendrobium chrysotoxum]|uniref:Uncharacterized protein n=1 Tax=Dendrobium chrysotoxum TaxID=161865 RepID=A0AAV7HTM6_DENCH|nr:hypothetical protein IEQ34_000680 [Dendrobium chrysotoxum]